jgi:hypothetical protein
MHKDHDPLEQLAAAAGRVCSGNSTESMRKAAYYGYLQATIAQADTQAIINLLLHHLGVPREQIDRALDDARRKRYEQLSGSASAVLTPAPTTKPQ